MPSVRAARPDEAVVGFVVNPRSGQDIRRLVARASVFPNTEKVMMLQRVLGALGAVGVDRVVAVADVGGVTGSLAHAVETHDDGRDSRWPVVDLLELTMAGGPADTLAATSAVVALGVRAIVVLGGDGTDRLVASVCGDVPMVPLSTGTNNAFAQIEEATVAGLAAGLLATGRLAVSDACRRSKVLWVSHRERRELGLVDVAVTTSSAIGARAVWEMEDLTELYVTFADPAAIGLSSIAGLVRPVGRDEPIGLRLSLRADAARRVLAPIAPGLVREVGVESVEDLAPARLHVLATRTGVIAVDGEREIELRGEPATIELSLDGPWRLDVPTAMHVAASRGLLLRR